MDGPGLMELKEAMISGIIPRRESTRKKISNVQVSAGNDFIMKFTD
jgi:hypothetical protein